ARGEAHGLIGQNGAGKSTLVRCLVGDERPERGTIDLDGARLDLRSPRDGIAAGLATIHPELVRGAELSVAENVSLRRLPRRWFGIDWKACERAARSAWSRVGLDLDVRRPLGSFPVAVQQLVAIAIALDRTASVLVLDEPTASLDARESRGLFD